MKMMIEIRDGAICNIAATGECSIYIVDHDEIKKGGMLDEGELEAAREACQPDRITWELDDDCNDTTPEFITCLDEALEEYAPPEKTGTITGYYDAGGYWIEDQDGKILYQAGNNPHESTGTIDSGLPLETIKGFCEKTGQEMADELNATFAGVFESDDNLGE